MMITLARAAGVPARIASVYALGVEPQDFHAVAEIFLGGEWHLVDATGMAEEGAMAKIGVGRDAADVSFLTVFGTAVMNGQSVKVAAA
ncbi:transglutaminase-like domain-containing protein [Sphingomonas agrestis]